MISLNIAWWLSIITAILVIVTVGAIGVLNVLLDKTKKYYYERNN